LRILLASCGGIGAWMLLRFAREGHACDWFDLAPYPKSHKVLKGLIPPPLESPNYDEYDLCVFDLTGHGDIAEEISEVVPVIGDSIFASKLEDDRLFGIQVMEEAGIEVPAYESFQTPEEAKAFIVEFPKRYVFKPFTVDGVEQDGDTTYVSDSAEDMLKVIDKCWKDAKQVPFLLQEVVEGIEVAVNGYFDGASFHFVTHTLEEKKFMAGGYGPNTGCSGNLIYWPERDNRLVGELKKLVPFLKESGYKGPLDLNTIVSENHAYGLEFTPRFGFDSTASEISMLGHGWAQFLYEIATAPEGGYIDHDPTPEAKGRWAASERLTIPPYPEENPSLYASKVPIKGIDLDWAWINCYMWDARLDGDDLVTVGLNGNICSPVACGHTPEGAWKGLDRISKPIKFPNLQCRDDLEESTLKRLAEVRQLGWLS
jgi:phosphoribosylamine-glycine ligase